MGIALTLANAPPFDLRVVARESRTSVIPPDALGFAGFFFLRRMPGA